MKRILAGATLAVCTAIPAHAAGLEATAVLKRAEAVMGAAGLKTLRYAGTGSAASFGQAYRAGMPWPKLTLSAYTRVIDYDKAAWLTPHGVIKAALRNNARLQFRTQGGKEIAAVSFAEPGKYAATAFINEAYLVERVESRMPNPVLGDTAVVTTYEDYRQHGEIRFPARIRQSAGGHPVFDLAVSEVQPNAAVDLPVPEVVRGFAERVTSEKAADGVWYLAGASHHSVAIEMQDHLIVVESPLYDGRAAPMLEAVKKLAPGKPIRTVVSSHLHFDHAGGLRTAAAEGAGEKMVLKDASRTVEIHHLKDSIHAVPFLMVYLPKERLLIQADAYTPLAPNAAPPSPPNANNVNLAQNIERLKLDVERILPLHGRIVPLAELYRTIGR